MLFATHLLAGIVVGVLVTTLFSVTHPIIFFFILCLGALLPDIDHPKSFLGRKLWFLSWIFNTIAGHRGLFHSFFIAGSLFFLLFSLEYKEIGIAISLGYTVHLFLDMLTKEGVPLFWPFRRRLKGIVKTGGFFELLFIILLFFILIFLIKYTL